MKHYPITHTALWFNLLLLGCLLATVLIGCGLILVARDSSDRAPLHHGRRSQIIEVHEI
jgi:hypothetical protein